MSRYSRSKVIGLVDARAKSCARSADIVTDFDIILDYSQDRTMLAENLCVGGKVTDILRYVYNTIKDSFSPQAKPEDVEGALAFFNQANFLGDHDQESFLSYPPQFAGLYAHLVKNIIHSSQIKSLLQQIISYTHTLTGLTDQQKFECLFKFPNSVGEGYGHCVQGVRERLEYVQLNIVSSTPTELLLRNAHDGVMHDALRLRANNREDYIDVHWQTILNWMVGVGHDKTTQYTTHLYDGFVNRDGYGVNPFCNDGARWKFYQEYSQKLSKKILEKNEENLKKIVEFLAARPFVNEDGEALYYDDAGNKYRLAGSFYRYIDGVKVTFIKDTQRGGFYHEVEGGRIYGSGNLRSADKILEDKLREMSVISPTYDPQIYANFVDPETNNWLPEDQLIAALKQQFFPTIIINRPKDSGFGDDEKSVIDSIQEEGYVKGIHLPKTKTKEAIIRGLKSVDREERVAAVNALYIFYGGLNYRDGSSYESYNYFMMSFGLSLMTEDEISSSLGGSKKFRELAISKAKDFFSTFFSENPATKEIDAVPGVPYFMGKKLMEDLGAMSRVGTNKYDLPIFMDKPAAGPRGVLGLAGAPSQAIKVINKEALMLFINQALNANDFKSIETIIKKALELAITEENKKTIFEALSIVFTRKSGLLFTNGEWTLEVGEQMKSLLTCWKNLKSDANIESIGGFNDGVSIIRAVVALVDNNDNKNKALRFLLCECSTVEHTEVIGVLNARKTLRASFLLDALKKGCKNAVKLALNDKEIDQQIFEGKTPLQIAVENNHLELVKFLLTKSSPSVAPEVHVDLNNQAFDAALDKDNLEIALEFLEEPGCDFHHFFSRFIIKGHLDLARKVIEKFRVDHINKDGYSFLHTAALLGNTSMVSYIVEKNPRLKLIRIGAGGEFPLNIALRSENKELINSLLEDQKDVENALEYLSQHGGKEEVVSLLKAAKDRYVEVDAKKFVENFVGASATGPRLTVEDGEEVAELIVSNSENLAQIFQTGSIEHLRALAGGKDIAKEAIAKNANNLLHLVLTTRSNERDALSKISLIFECLRVKGGDVPKIINSPFNRKLPMDIAISKGYNEIITKLFIPNGADINARNISGARLLNAAIMERNEVMAVHLLNLGINLDDNYTKSISPLLMAATIGADNKIVRKILKRNFDPQKIAQLFDFKGSNNAEIIILIGALNNTTDDGTLGDLRNTAEDTTEEALALDDDSILISLFNISLANGNYILLKNILDKITPEKIPDILNPLTGNPPFNFAVENCDDLKILDLLASKGAHIGRANQLGVTPFRKAISKAIDDKGIEKVAWFLKHTDCTTYTDPIYYAAYYKVDNLLNELLRRVDYHQALRESIISPYGQDLENAKRIFNAALNHFLQEGRGDLLEDLFETSLKTAAAPRGSSVTNEKFLDFIQSVPYFEEVYSKIPETDIYKDITDFAERKPLPVVRRVVAKREFTEKEILESNGDIRVAMGFESDGHDGSSLDKILRQEQEKIAKTMGEKLIAFLKTQSGGIFDKINSGLSSGASQEDKNDVYRLIEIIAGAAHEVAVEIGGISNARLDKDDIRGNFEAVIENEVGDQRSPRDLMPEKFKHIAIDDIIKISSKMSVLFQESALELQRYSGRQINARQDMNTGFRFKRSQKDPVIRGLKASFENSGTEL